MMKRMYVFKKNSIKKVEYTIRLFPFNPKKHFISTQEAKDISRKDMHCSKKKMTDEYDSIYGTWTKIGRGKNTQVVFNRSTKDAANIIFIIPKKWRRRTWKLLEGLYLPYDKEIFK